MVKTKRRKKSSKVIMLSVFAAVILGGTMLTYALPSMATPQQQPDDRKQHASSGKTKTNAVEQAVAHPKAATPPAASVTSAPTQQPGNSATVITAAPSPAPTASAPVTAAPASYTYRVNEQFSGSSLDPSLWQAMSLPKGYRNNEEQDYLPSQVSVANGALQINATRDANGNWHSGEVNSKWHYTYGTFEVRMALSATGPGVWPAAWIMGTTGEWPSGGEIDMFENVNGNGYAYGTMHGSGSNGEWRVQQAVGGIDVTQYHTYKLVKLPNYMSWWVDGIKQADWTPAQVPAGGIWPFENHDNIGILNLAIGGVWPGPSSSATPSNITMSVDYFTVKNGS